MAKERRNSVEGKERCTLRCVAIERREIKQ
jgi:hypothetical protein